MTLPTTTASLTRAENEESAALERCTRRPTEANGIAYDAAAARLDQIILGMTRQYAAV